MSRVKLFAGIEGYASSVSVGTLADSSGKILAAKRKPFALSLHTILRADLIVRLNELLQELFEAAGFSLNSHPPCRLCLGLAGTNGTLDYKDDLPELLFEAIGLSGDDKIVCTGDCEIILASHAYGPGSLIMSGMGSRTFFSTEKGRFAFHGGWGPVLGDPGSGFAIGTRLLHHLANDFDCGHNISILWKCVAQHLRSIDHKVPVWRLASAVWNVDRLRFRKHGSSDYRALLFSFAHQVVRDLDFWEWRNVCSSLAIPLMKAWTLGCEAAEKIGMQAAKALVESYTLGLEKVGSTEVLQPLVLSGGVLRNNPVFVKAVLGELRVDDSVNVIHPTDSNASRPAVGALLFALGRSRTAHSLRLPSSDMIARVRQGVPSWSELSF